MAPLEVALISGAVCTGALALLVAIATYAYICRGCLSNSTETGWEG